MLKKISASNLSSSFILAIAVIFSYGGNKAQALNFNFTPAEGTSQEAINGFNRASSVWSSLFNDPVTININIAFTSLGAGILGSASSSKENVNYSDFRDALSNDRTSADDFMAVANLPTTSTFNLLINYTSNSPNGSGSSVTYLDNDGDSNNQSIWVNTATKKALGLSITAASDASISFSTNFTFDFNPDDGISSGAYDFVGIATHEIGHVLGFISGVDILDGNSSNSFFRDDQFTFVSPLDLYRFSSQSAAEGAIDWTANTNTKYFSIDRGVTNLATFSTGVTHGDGQQASHWKDSLAIGIMDPTAGTGEILEVSNRDVRAFDVIGWNRSIVAVPEPLTILGAMTAVGFGAGFKRKLAISQKSKKDNA